MDDLAYLFRCTIPPGLNNRMFCHGKRMVLAKSYRDWKKNVVAELQAWDEEEPRRLPAKCRYRVMIKFSFQDRRRRDIDGYAKPILDAITESGVAWDDDEQVDYLGLYRAEPGHGIALIGIQPVLEDDT